MKPIVRVRGAHEKRNSYHKLKRRDSLSKGITISSTGGLWGGRVAGGKGGGRGFPGNMCVYVGGSEGRGQDMLRSTMPLKHQGDKS
jgi:hypothetical protein